MALLRLFLGEGELCYNYPGLRYAFVYSNILVLKSTFILLKSCFGFLQT